MGLGQSDRCRRNSAGLCRRPARSRRTQHQATAGIRALVRFAAPNGHPLAGNEAVKQAILAGLGISALSCHALALHQAGQFAVLNAQGFPIRRHWYAVYPASRQPSVVARAFINFLLEQKKTSACAPEGDGACCEVGCCDRKIRRQKKH
ncbi:MAG: hypothetical protein HY850_10560 [Betaproteobacteria bacterium]|nr:hypothetical protein [Betaproteobacteria bacterium]